MTTAKRMGDGRYAEIATTLARVKQGRGGPADHDSLAGMAEELLDALAVEREHDERVGARPLPPVAAAPGSVTFPIPASLRARVHALGDREPGLPMSTLLARLLALGVGEAEGMVPEDDALGAR